MKLSRGKLNHDKRRKPRKFFSDPIFYDYQNRICKAMIKNYSVSGLFIKAKDSFIKGARIDVAIPQSDDRVTKYIGKIVWCCNEGCGVELTEKL